LGGTGGLRLEKEPSPASAGVGGRWKINYLLEFAIFLPRQQQEFR